MAKSSEELSIQSSKSTTEIHAADDEATDYADSHWLERATRPRQRATVRYRSVQRSNKSVSS
ncbi:hypothetical protein BRD19_10005 [Halobacteriales archaeon SW_7_65_23]|nr:MAG: hypothetical protein BRD19_10005 [Halobacteriales archaeon SW_7_65_23]